MRPIKAPTLYIPHRANHQPQATKNRFCSYTAPMQDVLRILDANLNRAREGLRTAEEYARFVINDATALATLKTVRRSLEGVIEALGPAAPSLLQARDIPGDIGLEP